jgi:peptidyl-prolyl cis-trans isomerase B (cyclophilin B)
MERKVIADAESGYAKVGNTPFSYTETMRKVYAEQGGAPHLDGQYTVFGQVLEGMEVVDWIAQQPTEAPDRPLKDVVVTVEVVKMTDAELREKYPNTYPLR